MIHVFWRQRTFTYVKFNSVRDDGDSITFPFDFPEEVKRRAKTIDVDIESNSNTGDEFYTVTAQAEATRDSSTRSTTETLAFVRLPTTEYSMIISVDKEQNL